MSDCVQYGRRRVLSTPVFCSPLDVVFHSNSRSPTLQRYQSYYGKSIFEFFIENNSVLLSRFLVVIRYITCGGPMSEMQ